MSKAWFAVALGFAAGAILGGCTKESNPPPTVGQTEAQASSSPAGVVELPPGTSLAEESAVARETDRIYRTDLTYRHAVAYFDRLRSSAGCENTSRMTTEIATFWSLRCPDGRTASMAVRNTLPTTIEVLGGSAAP